MEQYVPKRRHIKFRRRGITQKKACNNRVLHETGRVTRRHTNALRTSEAQLVKTHIAGKTISTVVVDKDGTHLLWSVHLFCMPYDYGNN